MVRNERLDMMSIKELNDKYEADGRPIKVRRSKLVGWCGAE